MDITPASQNPSRRANPDWFTGTVWQDPIFEPGARTAWHTHPLGQTLHVVHGIGHVQAKGGPVRVIRTGDTVFIPPGEKHWHGASPTHGMAHIAMHEFDGETHVTWMEQVTDEEYAVAPTA